MAHHKSALKRIQIAERNQARNRYYRSTMRTRIKQVYATDSKEQATEALKNAASILDKLVAKGIIHKNKAANKKSSLMKYVNSLT